MLGINVHIDSLRTIYEMDNSPLPYLNDAQNQIVKDNLQKFNLKNVPPLEEIRVESNENMQASNTSAFQIDQPIRIRELPWTFKVIFFSLYIIPIYFNW